MTAPRVSPLEAHLCYWLRYVSNHVSHAFALKVAARGVSVAEWVVMRELYGAAAVPSALAEKLGMTRGGISKIVDRLEAKAMVSRTTSTTDRRSQTLALTKSGQALVPKLAELADRNDEEFFGHLDAKQRARLEAAMKDIVRRMGLRTVPLE